MIPRCVFHLTVVIASHPMRRRVATSAAPGPLTCDQIGRKLHGVGERIGLPNPGNPKIPKRTGPSNTRIAVSLEGGIVLGTSH